MVRGFEIVVGVGRVVASLTEMRQKTYWTSQTVTAHKDGWPSLLVTTSVQGGPVTVPPLPAFTPDGRWQEGRKEGFSHLGGKLWATWCPGPVLCGHPVPTNYQHQHCLSDNKILSVLSFYFILFYFILSASINKR